MSKNDRNQRKKKERQDRIRREKHERHFGSAKKDDADVPPFGVEGGPNVPRWPARERTLWDLVQGTPVGGGGGKRTSSAREEARELAYQAMEETNPAESARLAQRALSLDPDCADAITALASNPFTSLADKIELLERAVAAAERTLGGPSYFKENRGRFWGLLETRPYVRARAGLAEVLLADGRVDEAIRHYVDLLDLNPNDNLGLRETLLGCYLQIGNLAGVRGLFERYPESFGATFAYARVLERLLSHDPDGAEFALGEARRRNRHVEPFLTGQKQLSGSIPTSYVVGSETEAIHCAFILLDAWTRRPEAVAWLKGMKEADH